MFLITGATGNIGGELARILHREGHATRALVRDPRRAADLPAPIERAVEAALWGGAPGSTSRTCVRARS